jgi:hypothetical protein
VAELLVAAGKQAASLLLTEYCRLIDPLSSGLFEPEIIKASTPGVNKKCTSTRVHKMGQKPGAGEMPVE